MVGVFVNIIQGLKSLIMIYSQVDYAIKCMKYAKKKQLIAIEPKLAAQKAYTKNIKSQFKGTVWKTGCSSWYLNKDGEVSSFYVYEKP